MQPYNIVNAINQSLLRDLLLSGAGIEGKERKGWCAAEDGQLVEELAEDHCEDVNHQRLPVENARDWVAQQRVKES